MVTSGVRGSDVGAGTTGGNIIASPAEVQRRTHRGRVTTDGNFSDGVMARGYAGRRFTHVQKLGRLHICRLAANDVQGH
jgi:hypothetical protein